MYLGEVIAASELMEVDPETGNSIPMNLCDTITGINITEQLLCNRKGTRIEGSPHLGKLNPKWQTTPCLINQE